MPLFKWSQKYSVNVRKFDDAHKKLIGLINELHDAMKARRGMDVIGKVIADLTEYTIFHFSDEEKLFALHSYPDRAAHKIEHSAFVKRVKELQSKYDGGFIALSSETTSFLMDWLSKHIMIEDKKYSDFLNGKGVE